MLGMVLNDVSSSIEGAVKELESAILLSKNIQVKTAYMVTALNDLNAVLSDILESEKMSLASALTPSLGVGTEPPSAVVGSASGSPPA